MGKMKLKLSDQILEYYITPDGNLDNTTTLCMDNTPTLCRVEYAASGKNFTHMVFPSFKLDTNNMVVGIKFLFVGENNHEEIITFTFMPNGDVVSTHTSKSTNASHIGCIKNIITNNGIMIGFKIIGQGYSHILKKMVQFKKVLLKSGSKIYIKEGKKWILHRTTKIIN